MPNSPATSEVRPPRRLGRGLVALLALLIVGDLGVAWYFADQLTLPATVRPFEPDSSVIAADASTVTLEDRGFAALDGEWGLQLPQQRHVVLEGPLERSAAGVTYSWRDATGTSPKAGEPVRIDEFVYVGTPMSALGLPYDEVEVAGPDGPLPSWWVPANGEPRGTVVFTHGRGATREEALRFLPALVLDGWNVLVHTYAGDEGAPPLTGGRVHFGTTEWADVRAAVAHVDGQAADRPLVLFATSMGGALVGQLLDESQLADEVDGVILDSPLLSMDALLDLQAGLNGIPEAAEPVLLPVVQWIANLLHGLDAERLEQVEADGTFDLPVLLFHGDADTFVPPEPSQAFAANHDDVTFVRVPEAGHVRSWNVDREGYEDALRTFLTRIAR